MSRRRRRELEQLFKDAEQSGKEALFYTFAQVLAVALMVFGVIYFILRVTGTI